jgi:hypothetical protein
MAIGKPRFGTLPGGVSGNEESRPVELSGSGLLRFARNAPFFLTHGTAAVKKAYEYVDTGGSARYKKTKKVL